MNNENIICETTSFRLSPDGSEFYHCTPDVLGTFSNQILALDLSEMRYEGTEIKYYWEPFDGKAVPQLSLRFSGHNRNHSGLIHLLIICDFGLQSGDGNIREEKQIPDCNNLTSFYGIDVSIKLDCSTNHFDDGIISGYTENSELTITSDFGSFTIECFSFCFKIEE
jgi:hypothetical protein